jgi:hypothetical protein
VRPALALGVLAVASLAPACREAPRAPEPIPSSILSPADFAAQSCPVEGTAGLPAPVSAVPTLLRDHVPRALPPGFGVLVSWRAGGSGLASGAAWADIRCRTVVVRLRPGPAGALDGPRVGDWFVIQDGPCSNGLFQNVPCTRYAAEVTGGRLEVATVALTRAEADQIALSIPLEL